MYVVAFDLDDTLYGKEYPLKKAFINYSISENVGFNSFLITFKMESDIAFEQVNKSLLTLEQSRILRIKKTFQKYNEKISDGEASSFQKLYEKYQSKIILYPYITKVFEYLFQQNIQIIIITNGPVNHQRNKIKNLGLEKYFQPNHIIVSGEEGVAKPNPKIYHIAEEQFALEKEKTWYVGDNYQFDMVGAKSVGWNTIWLNRNKEKVDSQAADVVVNSTLDLYKSIRKIFQ